MNATLSLSITLTGLPVICLAQSAANGCDAAATTAAMLNCENSRLQKADQALNATYSRLMNKLDSTGKAKLRTAQRAWLTFRKLNAAFLSDEARGGTAQPLIATAVTADMTEARTKELAESLDK